jgi:hypothetical protein
MFDPRAPELIPAEILESLERYGGHGVPVGSFLEACIANDLTGAAARADMVNVTRLAAIATFIMRELPRPSWGSQEAYNAWVEYHAAIGAGDAGREVAARERVQAALRAHR